MAWVYLSPHLDDAALSCGGAIWEQVQQGDRVVIWTACAGDPPAGPLSPLALALHRRWQTGRDAVALRRTEDRRACERLGASWSHGSLPDGIYRRSNLDGRPLYATEGDLFGTLHPEEGRLVTGLAEELARELHQGDRLVVPLALGGHVDHRLARMAAEALGRTLWFYADFPYVVQAGDGQAPRQGAPPQDGRQLVVPVSPEGLEAWQAAVAAHRSQISTFWPHLEAMRSAIAAYHHRAGGILLWNTESPPGRASAP